MSSEVQLSGNEMLNKKVLSSRRKVRNDEAVCRDTGRVFDARAAATGNARSPRLDRLNISARRRNHWNRRRRRTVAETCCLQHPQCRIRIRYIFNLRCLTSDPLSWVKQVGLVVLVFFWFSVVRFTSDKNCENFISLLTLTTTATTDDLLEVECHRASVCLMLLHTNVMGRTHRRPLQYCVGAAFTADFGLP